MQRAATKRVPNEWLSAAQTGLLCVCSVRVCNIYVCARVCEYPTHTHADLAGESVHTVGYTLVLQPTLTEEEMPSTDPQCIEGFTAESRGKNRSGGRDLSDVEPQGLQQSATVSKGELMKFLKIVDVATAKGKSGVNVNRHVPSTAR